MLRKILLLLTVTMLCKISSIEAVVLAGGNPSTVAGPTDSYAGLTNPAGIMYVGDRIDGGFRWHNDIKHVRVVHSPVPKANGYFDASYKRKNFIIPDAAVNKTFKTQCGCKEWEWALNFASYTHFYNRSTWKHAHPLAGTTPPDYMIWMRGLTATLALKLSEQHALGASIEWNKYRIAVSGIQNFANPLLSVAPRHVTNIGYENSYNLTCRFGWRWQVTKQFALGVVYTPQSNYRFHNHRGLYPQHGLLCLPQELRFGVLYVFHPKIIGVFDITWINWSKTTNGNRLLNAIGQFNTLGSKHGAVTGFKDQYHILAGLQYNYSKCLELRAAYLRLTPVVPRSQTYYNAVVVPIVADLAIVGATYKFWTRSEFSFYYAHGFHKKLRGAHSLPPSVGGGNVNLYESLNLIGLSFGYKY